MISISIRDHGADAMFRQLAAMGRSPREITVPAGRAVQNLLRRHYRENEGRPIRHPGAKKHYWLEVMRSVQAPVAQDGGRSVVVSITHPTIGHKVRGGTIAAKRVRALTIPVSAAAYEAGSASTFEHETGEKLFAVGRDRSGTSGVLATRNADGSLNIHYVLRRSVNQVPDPRALPSVQSITRTAVATMRDRLARLIRRFRGTA